LRGGIEVAYIELAKLGASNAGGVEDFENGAITQPEEIGGIGVSPWKRVFLTGVIFLLGAI
jgi:hypothetical protein